MISLSTFFFVQTYAGSTLSWQANPLNHKQHEIHLMGGSRGMLAAKQPLVVPMLLRLSHFRLNSYIVLVVSKQKGITLVFKTDPLQNVDINSTFDSIAVIQKFIQKEIEGQLRQMFREDLPGIIHRLSQQWVKAKVEAPYLDKKPSSQTASSRPSVERMTMSAPDLRNLAPRFPAVGLQPSFGLGTPAPPPPYPRSQSLYGATSVASTSRRSAATTAARTSPSRTRPARALDAPETAFPDIENFDPTYGLRPEGLPAKSVFGGFGRLFGANRGLADLAEEPSDGEDEFEEGASYDVVDWEDMLPDDSTRAPSVADADEYEDMRADVEEYETLPAVGGGVITRPRVVHAQSQIQTPVSAGGSRMPRAPSVASTPPLTRAALERLTSPGSVPILTPHPVPRRASSMYNPYFPDVGPSRNGHARATSTPPTPPLYRSPSSVHTQPSRSSSHTHSIPTPPSTDLLHAHASPSQPQRKRRPSLSSSTSSPYPYPASAAGTHPLDALFPDPLHAQDPDPAPQAVVLRPALNNHVSQIATLAHSNHTLSPYTRALEHFTVRSVPPRALAPPPAPPAPVRARRRRTYRLGGVGTGAGATDPASVPPSPPRPRARGGAGADADASGGAAHAAGLGAPASPVLPSEFDAEEMDRYFRARDELEHYPPELHPSHVRRRRHASYQAS